MATQPIQYCPPETFIVNDKHLPLFVNIAKKLKTTKGIIASVIIYREQMGQTTSNADLYSIISPLFSKRKIDNAANWLVNEGFLEIADAPLPAEVRALLFTKGQTPWAYKQKFWTEGKSCEWCQGLALRLHKHHYPIPKSEEGTETENICPSCHDEFHFMLEGKGYKITQKLYDLQGSNNER